MSDALLSTDLPLENRRTGKVRELYDVRLPDGSDGLLIIATDRISAFDVVLGTGIPTKGAVLTRLSRFWFAFLEGIDNHLVSMEVADVEGISDAERSAIEGRIMLCRKAEVIPVECIVRGYLTGSGWVDYQASGQLCGIELPQGLRNSDRLETPLFTPSTKAVTGHDENISFEEACAAVGEGVMTRVRDLAIEIYSRARDYAAGRGIIIADTKFEFGLMPGSDEPVLIDEVLTPDSSRFWPADEWEPGREQNSFDKQYVRNYLLELVADGKWDKKYPAPTLPDEVVRNTLRRYTDAYEKLTGASFEG